MLTLYLLLWYVINLTIPSMCDLIFASIIVLHPKITDYAIQDINVKEHIGNQLMQIMLNSTQFDDRPSQINFLKTKVMCF